MTRKAIGWYAIDATDAEKIEALTNTIYDASAELTELGLSELALERIFDEAYARHEEAIS